MVEITDRESLEAWLAARPREDAVQIAARAALRVVPALATALDLSSAREAIILPALRAGAASWVAVVRPTQGAEVQNAARAASATAAVATAARAAATAAAAAASAAYAAYAARAAADAVRAAGDIAPGEYDPRDYDPRDYAVAGDLALWQAVERDAGRLKEGTAHAALAASPLWPDEPPARIMEAWQTLSKALLGADPGWWVWTDWYQARLDGRPFDKALEEARVLIPDETWEQGSKAVNAEIARLIEEHSPSLRHVAAQRIARQPKRAAENAERERAKLERRIEELRASLPNDPEGLEEAQSEIAELEAMSKSLETVVTESLSLPGDARPEDAELAAAAVDDLAVQLKTWVRDYLTKERADAAADAVLLAGLVGLLTLFGMPAWLAGSYLIARFNGYDVIEKVKAIIRRSD